MKYSEFISENYDLFQEILECMRTGVWITDKDAAVVIVNQQSVGRGGMKREEVIGKTMTELIETGYIIQESSVLKAIESKKEESIVQELGAGGYLLATSVPLFYNGEIDLIICIERNVTDIANLGALLSKQKSITKKLQNELASLRLNWSAENKEMIAWNINSIKLREHAISISSVDATVMITGESGTGKEVIANLIHKKQQSGWSIHKDKLCGNTGIPVGN